MEEAAGGPSAAARPTAQHLTLSRRVRFQGMSQDRLTALDASFLHLEDGSSHMHVASVMLFEGDPPPTTSCSSRSSGGCTWCRATARSWRSCRSARGARAGSTTLTSTCATTCARPRSLPRAARSSCATCRPRVRAAARPRQAAVGDLAGRGTGGRPLRAAVEDPPRAGGRHLGRGHHDRALRHLARSGRAARPGAAGCRARCPRARSCSARRCWSARPCPASSPARARLPRPAPGGQTPRDAAAGVGAMAGPGSTRRPPAPTTCEIGPHRRFTWVRADLDASRRSRTSWAAP